MKPGISTRRTSLGLAAAAIFCTLLAGCNAGSEPERFVLRPDVTKLHKYHQAQIEKTLARYYGVAGDPRWMTPAEAKPGAESDGGAAGQPGDVVLVARLEPQHLERGMQVFNKNCASCHGVTGDGEGAAAQYLDPKPRDYRNGKFKFISTPRGGKPRRDDLVRVITWGAKGTSMPSFRWMADEDRAAVIDYVMLLSHRGELELNLVQEVQFELDDPAGDEPTAEERKSLNLDLNPQSVAQIVRRVEGFWAQAPLQVVQPTVPNPPMTEETIRLGAIAFQQQACTKCHGADGRGGRRPDVDPNNLPKDDWGHVAFAADLTSGMLHGGRRPIDVYRRISAGINGTPMPAFEGAYRDSPETFWHLTHFIVSVVEGGEFQMPEAPQTPAGAAAPPPEAAGAPAAATDDASAPDAAVAPAPEARARAANPAASVD
jgi:mono/diheme cytochrome c family protein